MKVERIGIVIHPLSVEDFRKNFCGMYAPASYALNFLIKRASSYRIKQIISQLSEHKLFETNSFSVKNKKILKIIGIMCPLFPEQMVSNPELARQRILRSITLAKKCGCSIVTLAGFTSIVSDGGRRVLSGQGIFVTSGNTLTSALCIESVKKACYKIGRSIAESTVSIIGASGDIGSACALFFGRKAKKLILCSRSIREGSEAVLKIKKASYAQVAIAQVAKDAVKDADIVVIATSSFTDILSVSDFKANAIVCDVSIPSNVSVSEISGQKVYIYSGGRASLGFYDKIEGRAWKQLFPSNLVFGCLAESIALAIDGRICNFSLGKGEITLDSIEEILNIAQRNEITAPIIDFRICGL